MKASVVNGSSPRQAVAGIPDEVIWRECTVTPCRKCPQFEEGRVQTSGCRIVAELSVRDRLTDCAPTVQ